MSKKSKNKGSNKTAAMKSQSTQSFVKSVSDEQIKRIEELKEGTSQKMETSGLEPEELNEDEKAKIAEAERTNDIKKYLKELEDIHRQLLPLKREADELKAAAQEERDKVKTERKSLEEDKSKLNEKTAALNAKEKDVLERELQLDNGEFTGTIRSLLDTFGKSGKDIADETKKLIDDLCERQKDLMQKQKEVDEKAYDFETEKNQLAADRKKLEREKRNLDADREIFKEEARDEMEAEFSGKYEDEKSRADMLKQRNEILEQKVEGLERKRQELFVAFGDKTPEDILTELGKYRKESEDLREELNKRPTEDDLESQRKQVNFLTSENEKYKKIANEEEYARLRTIIENTDSYIIEIQGYKDRLESSHNREESLKRTIQDLQSTVEQLKGEHQKDDEAFQYARKYDVEPDLQNKGFIDNPPRTLYEFANYMQHKIASSEKPFYYDIDTIKIFIAGLNMSNISILQGISGTGKTSLPREFAKAIISEALSYQGNSAENTPNAPYRICAVQSGWRDNMDLMGYYNSFEHKYKETEFFKALYLANLPKYNDTLFFIILDEMNLSRPEHYFADFLSLLEQNEDERYITINAPDEVLPKEIVQGKLKVPANVRFIGTANHDETTLEFAPKTYDRSNLMEMPKNQERNIAKTSESYNIGYKWLSQQFNIAKKKHADFYEEFKKFINSDDVKMLLMEKGIGIGNRFEDQAERFICAFIEAGNPDEKKQSLATAADHLITTRLFRTLKNRYDINEQNLKDLKESFDKYFNNAFSQMPKYADDLLNSEIDKK